jgi:hypothetical protein
MGMSFEMDIKDQEVGKFGPVEQRRSCEVVGYRKSSWPKLTA